MRLDRLHIVFRSVLKRNIIAPISAKPRQILDVATGSGAWCIEVADEYPGANVVAIDLLPIQATRIPLNCEFIVADLNRGLDFDDASLDLVQSRSLPKADLR